MLRNFRIPFKIQKIMRKCWRFFFIKMLRNFKENLGANYERIFNNYIK